MEANDRQRARRRHEQLRDLIIFAIFGAMMFGLKQVMAALPNIHPLAMFVVLLTVVYRSRALIPIYLYVFLEGLYIGLSPWWFAYLYIWTILWGVTMLLPKKMKPSVAAVVYPLICGIFGIVFGALYAPLWAVINRLSFEATLGWIVAGLYFDILHAIGNTAIGCLVLPLSIALRRLIGEKN